MNRPRKGGDFCCNVLTPTQLLHKVRALACRLYRLHTGYVMSVLVSCFMPVGSISGLAGLQQVQFILYARVCNIYSCTISDSKI